MKLIVRFGEEFNNDNEELLVFHWEFEIDIAQYIHEIVNVTFKTSSSC
jgi:hypothetical protein